MDVPITFSEDRRYPPKVNSLSMDLVIVIFIIFIVTIVIKVYILCLNIDKVIIYSLISYDH